MVGAGGKADRCFLTLKVPLTGSIRAVSVATPDKQLPGSANADAADLFHCARVVGRFAQHQSPAHPVKSHGECLRADAEWLFASRCIHARPTTSACQHSTACLARPTVTVTTGGVPSDLREGLHAVQAPSEQPRQPPGTPRKETRGVP